MTVTEFIGALQLLWSHIPAGLRADPQSDFEADVRVGPLRLTRTLPAGVVELSGCLQRGGDTPDPADLEGVFELAKAIASGCGGEPVRCRAQGYAFVVHADSTLRELELAKQLQDTQRQLPGGRN